MSSEIYRLPGRAIIALDGPDARPLLQRVITTDVDKIGEGECRPGALLTPQGKIIVDFMLFPTETGLLIDVVESAAEALKKRLTLYRLKADVSLALREDMASLWSAEPFAGSAPDPRLSGQAHRKIDLARHCEERALDTLEIACGTPAFGRDYGEAEVFPTDVNLDAYEGIGWKKGCFIGQEVVSRMKRRGTIRKRSLAIQVEGEAPAKGTPLKAGDSTVGDITSASGHNAVGMVRLDRLEKAATGVTADGKTVQIDLPDTLRPDPAPETL